MAAMIGCRIRFAQLSSEAFAGLSDHARLPSRFHARLSATASRL